MKAYHIIFWTPSSLLPSLLVLATNFDFEKPHWQQKQIHIKPNALLICWWWTSHYNACPLHHERTCTGNTQHKFSQVQQIYIESPSFTSNALIWLSIDKQNLAQFEVFNLIIILSHQKMWIPSCGPSFHLVAKVLVEQ